MNKPKKGKVQTPNVRTPADVVRGINLHLLIWTLKQAHETGDPRWLKLGQPYQGPANEPRFKPVEPINVGLFA